MSFYYLYFLLLSSSFVSFRLSNHLTSFFVATLTFFLGYLRDYGPDTTAYVIIFSNFDNALVSFFDGNIEPFWLFFSYVLNLFELSPQFGFGLIAFLSAYVRTLAISIFFGDKRYLVFLGIIVFFSNDFIVRDLGQIRNGLMSSFLTLFLALALRKKETNKIIFSALFSVITHISGLIGLIAYYLTFYRSLYVVSIIGIIAAGITIVTLAEFFFGISNLQILEKLVIYSSSDIYIGESSYPIFFILSSFITIVGLIMFSYFDEIEKRLFLFYTFAPITFLTLFQFEVLSSRVSTIFTTINCLIIPIIIEKFILRFKVEQRTVIYLSGLYILIVILIYYLTNFVNTYSL